MNTSYNDAREFRHRATEFARRASATADPEMENSFRRIAHHWLIRAAELEASQRVKASLAGSGQDVHRGMDETPAKEERRRAASDRLESALPHLDAVDLASDQSFPASDPPAWIGRHGSN